MCVLVCCLFAAQKVAAFKTRDADEKSDVWRLYSSRCLIHTEQRGGKKTPFEIFSVMRRLWQADTVQWPIILAQNPRQLMENIESFDVRAWDFVQRRRQPGQSDGSCSIY